MFFVTLTKKSKSLPVLCAKSRDFPGLEKKPARCVNNSKEAKFDTRKLNWPKCEFNFHNTLVCPHETFQINKRKRQAG